MRHCRELQEWNNSKYVICKNEGEEREEERNEAHEFTADNFFTDTVADKGINRFASKLQLAWNYESLTLSNYEKG